MVGSAEAGFPVGPVPAPSLPPTRSVAELTMTALVIAGEGTCVPPPSSLSYHCLISAAKPVACGVACDVPETCR